MKFSDIIEFITNRKIGLRLGAFGLAVLLWVFIVSGETYEMVLKIPIEVRNLNEQKAMREEVPEFAQVKFDGTGRMLFKTILLKQFYPGFKMVLDVERISDGYNFVLNEYYQQYPQKVVVPNEFDIQYIEVESPREINISLDDYLVKTVLINQNITIEPAAGYIIVGKHKIEPTEIEIAGPKDIIENISSINSVVDTISDVTGRIANQYSLEIPNRQIQLSVDEVSISADIQALSERIVGEVPVIVKNVSTGYRVFVSPHTVSLTIIGGVNYIQNVTADDIELTIDFRREWQSDRQFYQPQVSIPQGVIGWQDLSPPNVELIVTQVNN